jgi:hypothetical protein
VNESDTAQEDIAKGWSSIQVLVLESLCKLCFSLSSHIVAYLLLFSLFLFLSADNNAQQ